MCRVHAILEVQAIATEAGSSNAPESHGNQTENLRCAKVAEALGSRPCCTRVRLPPSPAGPKRAGGATLPSRRARRAPASSATAFEKAGKALDVIEQIGRHTSELQSLMRISYAVFCLKKKNNLMLHRHLTIAHTDNNNLDT